MLHVGELVVALAHTGRPAEVVDRDRGEAALGKAQGELLVEPVEPADVGKDDDPGARRLVGRCGEGGEPVPVGRLEDQVVVRHGRSGDDGDRRQGVEVEAHAPVI